MDNIVRLIGFLNLIFLLSCNNKNSELLILSVDINQDNPILLSEITDNLRSVELELTDESMISAISKIVDCGNSFLVLDQRQMVLFLFDDNGRYIRQIGSRGQGPGEHSFLFNVVSDPINGYIYIAADNKIMCYNTEGAFINEKRLPDSPIEYITYIDDKFYYAQRFIKENITSEGFYHQTILYSADKDFNIIDSLEIRKVLFTSNTAAFSLSHNLSFTGDDVYLYFPLTGRETFLRDTLYHLEDNVLTPSVKLLFSDESVINEFGVAARFINEVYRSSRYIFVKHRTREDQGYLYYCYDLKTNEGYNMKGGFKDDLHTGELVQISPFASDMDKFYYSYTNLDNISNGDEPNPTLYIGTLKK